MNRLSNAVFIENFAVFAVFTTEGVEISEGGNA